MQMTLYRVTVIVQDQKTSNTVCLCMHATDTCTVCHTNAQVTEEKEGW